MDYPSRMIYGHTHLPLGLRSPREFSVLIETPAVREKLIINNTGGWLPKYCRGEDYLSFPGSEIFFFDAEQGLSSESIGYDPKDVGCL